MKEKKLAVIFTGIGYHKDKPLLYYAARLVKNKGFEVINVEFHDMPQKIIGDADMMRKAAEIALKQAEEQLGSISFGEYDKVLFIGKSIGTVTLARYAADHAPDAGQIWYTPVEATFSFGAKDVVAFIGDDDPWSDVSKVKQMGAEKGITLFSYPKCNHSLETDDVDVNLVNLRDVMKKTEQFIIGG